MSEELEEYLRGLERVVVGGEGGRATVGGDSTVKTSKEILGSIQALLEETYHDSPSTYGLLAAKILLGGTYSLVQISKVLNTAKQVSQKDTLAVCLDTIGDTLRIASFNGDSVHSSLLEVQALGIKAAQNRNLQAKRSSAFSLLAVIVEVYKDEEGLDVRQLVKLCKAERGDKADSTRNSVYQLQGSLAKHVPDRITQDDLNMFAKSILGDLKNQIQGNSYQELKLALIEACLIAIAGLLHSSPTVVRQHFLYDTSAELVVVLVVENNGVTFDELFSWMKLILDPHGKLKRFGSVKASMRLLLQHPTFFTTSFVREYRVIYEHLSSWTMKSDTDLRNLAFETRDCFMNQFFTEKFQETLAKDTEFRPVAKAAEAYGHFVWGVKHVRGTEGVTEMLNLVASRGSQIFLSGNPAEDGADSRMYYLTPFLKAFVRIAEVVENVSAENVGIIEAMHILCLENYPNLDAKYHPDILLLTYNLMSVLLRHNPGYCKRIVRMVLLRISSQPPLMSDVDEDTNDPNTLKLTRKKMASSNYFPLWDQLLAFRTNSTNEKIKEAIFGAMLQTVMELTGKLSFNTIESMQQEAEVTADRTEGMKPECQQDFWVFINLTELFSHILPQLQPNIVQDWIITLIRHFIQLSVKYPHVSGFNKVTALTLTQANKLRFFQDMGNHTKTSAEKRECYSNITSFAQKILSRINQVQDDLLVSCFDVILALPTSIVCGDIRRISVSFKSALALGLSYYPLAECCISTLHLWTDTLPQMELDTLCKKVVPCLDNYLQTEKTKQRVSGEESVAKKRKNSRRKLKVEKPRSPVDKDDNSSKLNEIRTQILLLLGKLGPMRHYLTTQSSEEVLGHYTAWDTNEHMLYNVPYPDLKPSIALDRFLPRVTELAVSSGDRTTKIAACELTHSLILFSLGVHSSRSNDAAIENPMDRIYGRLFPRVLKLCCDGDEVPRQLFRPLMQEIIHWFAGNKTAENPETNALLNTLMDSLISTDSIANEKDYAGYCLNEFLQWSFKQAGAGTHAPAANTASVLKRLKHYALHPSPHKRLGASLAFNAIYRTFRERPDFVDDYIIDLLITFLQSLAIAHDDEAESGTVVQCVQVIDNLKRIMCLPKYAIQLNTTSIRRRQPKQLQDKPDFKTVLGWLFDQLGRPEEHFRHQCWNLLKAFSTVEGIDREFKKVLQRKLGSHHKDKGKKAETHHDDKDYLHLIQSWESANWEEMGVEEIEESDFLSLCKWMEYLEATIEAHTNAFLPPFNFAMEKFYAAVSMKSIRMFDAVSYFLRKLAGLEWKCDGKSLTVNQETRFNRLRATICLRLLVFVSTILKTNDFKTGKTGKFSSTFWMSPLFKMMVTVCMAPEQMGFDVTDQVTLEQLPLVIADTLKQCVTSLDNPAKGQMLSYVENEISMNYRLESKTGSNQESFDTKFSIQVLQGYIILINGHVLDIRNPKWQKLGLSIWEEMERSLWTTKDGTLVFTAGNPLTRTTVSKALELAFMSNLKPLLVIERLMDERRCQVGLEESSTSLVGRLFLNYVKDLLPPLFSRTPAPWIRDLFQNGYNAKNVVLLTELCESVGKDRISRQKYGLKLVDVVLINCWSNLNLFSKDGPVQAIMVVDLLKKLFLIDTKFLHQLSSTKQQQKDVCVSVFSFFIDLLENKDKKVYTLDFKNKVLDLLGVYAMEQSGENDWDEKLEKALGFLSINHLPFRSAELVVGSPDCDTYMTTLRKLLFALSMSESQCILKVVNGMLCREDNHIAEGEITSHLFRYAQRLDTNKATHMTESLLEVFLGDGTNPTLRRNTLEKVLLPILSGLQHQPIVNFYLLHTKRIVDLLDTMVNPFQQDQVGKNADEEVVLETTRMGCFKLLELMYQKVSAAIIKDNISRRVCTPDKPARKNFQSTVTKIGKDFIHKAKGEVSLVMWESVCAAYNCTIALVIATQSDPRYITYMFPEGIWSTIVDGTSEYQFKDEIESDQKHRKKRNVRLQALRKTEERKGKKSLRFLSTQVLSQSSLSAELDLQDFTNASCDGDTQQLSPTLIDSINADSATNEAPISASQEENTVGAELSEEAEKLMMEAEQDVLNEHPCMHAILEAIIFANKHQKQGEVNMPSWMESMKKYVDHPLTPRNAKLLIARLCSMLPEVFGKWGAEWIPSLVNVVLESSDGLHYFHREILVTVLGWASHSLPKESQEGRKLVKRLLQYLIRNVQNPNNTLQKRNLELIGHISNYWKEFISIDQDLWETLPQPRKGEDISIWIKLFGTFIQNGITPFPDTVTLASDKASIMYKKVAMVMDEKGAKTWKEGAEVLGLCLDFLSSRGITVKEAVNNLGILPMLKRFEKEKAVNCIHYITRHCQGFAPLVRDMALENLVAHYGSLKMKWVDILTSAVRCGNDEPEEVFRFIYGLSTKFDALATNREEGVLQSSLALIEALLEKGERSVEELMVVLSQVEKFVEHSTVACRMTVVNICIGVMNNAAYSRKDFSECREKVKNCLLRLLSDASDSIRLKVTNFWCQEGNLGTKTVERALKVLGNVYSTESETQYLAYSTYLLLEQCPRSPDYDRPLFSEPLKQCDFENQKIDIHWRRRNVSLGTPLYADSLSTPLSTQGESMVGGSFGRSQALLQTQRTNLFTQTQNEGQLYDWVKEEAVEDTFSSQNSSYYAGSVDRSSGLIFRPKRRPLQAGASVKEKGSTTLDSQLLPDGETFGELKKLKRRVMKDKFAEKQTFARINSQKKINRELLEKERRASRDAKVSLYRSYRKGDYPDIQIPNKDILKSLQALAKQDPVIGSLLLEELLKGIFDQNKDHEARDKAVENIDKILDQCEFGPLISALLLFSEKYSTTAELSPAKVAHSAITGLEHHTGIYFLEQQLIKIKDDSGNARVDEEPQAKRARLEGQNGMGSVDKLSTKEESLWINVAKIYKDLEDFDSLNGIFVDKLHCSSEMRKGLQAEQNSQFLQAYTFYNEAFRNLGGGGDSMDTTSSSLTNYTEIQEMESDYLKESGLKCLNTLGEWERLSETALGWSVGSEDPDQIWNADEDERTPVYNQCASYFIRSRTKLLLDLGDTANSKNEEFLGYMQQWTNDKTKKDFITGNNGLDWALLELKNAKVEEAGYYCAKEMDKLLSEWTQLKKTESKMRCDRLECMQTLCELDQVIGLIRRKGSMMTEVDVSQLFKVWSGRSPDELNESPFATMDVFSNRLFYVKRFDNILKKTDTSRTNTIGPFLLNTCLQFARSCSQHKNFAMATELMNKTHQMRKVMKVEKGGEWQCTQGLVRLEWARYTPVKEKAIKILVGCLGVVENAPNKHESFWKSQLEAVRGASLQELAFLVGSPEITLEKLEEETRRNLLSRSGIGKKNKKEEVFVQLLSQAFSAFSSAVDEKQIPTADIPVQLINPRVCFVDFLDSILRSKSEDANRFSSLDSSAYSKIFVENVVGAMREGSESARRRFPRLMSVLEESHAAQNHFAEICLDAPSWMYIGWINQLLSNLFPCTHRVIQKIANDYPQAILYPLKIVLDSKKDAPDPFLTSLSTNLQQLDSFATLMVEAFEATSSPVQTAKESLGELRQILSTGNKFTLSDAVKNFVQYKRKEIFHINADDLPCDGLKPANYWKQFRERYLKEFDDLFGKDGEKLAKTWQLSHGRLQIVLQSWNSFPKDKFEKKMVSDSKVLADYSSFFLQYGTVNPTSIQMEIPGQYCGNKKPEPADHIRLAGFDRGVSVMSSLRKPKVITFLGNDGEGYKFLVKAGEDLRQDDRIEQVFSVMNGILQKDAQCRKRELNLTTYAVIPMTTRVGLIEFLPNVSPLKDILENIATKEEKGLISRTKVAREYYAGPGKCFAKDTTFFPNEYIDSYRKVKQGIAMKCYKNATKSIPAGLLRRALMEIGGVENFIPVRDQFTRSYATICASNYLLGIGDRHLSNLLLDTSTGTMVGIDFGHAFGTATQFLQVPELVPFRLTPQIQQVFQPIGIGGKFQAGMQNCLKSLRGQKHLLINTMEVFVKEPSIDWMQLAMRCRDGRFAMPEGVNPSDEGWYPKEKMDNAVAKLNGTNPVLLFKRDLEHGVITKLLENWSIMVGFICGKDEFLSSDLEKPRGKDKENLNPADQTQCLIEIATDPLTLARGYVGWEPWL